MRDRDLARLFGMQDAAATCASCHGPASPSAQPFDVKAALQRIDHWTAERAKRQPGAQAEAPRTWLAARLREKR
jgi:mono/diheme cytochrome c family protein